MSVHISKAVALLLGGALVAMQGLALAQTPKATARALMLPAPVTSNTQSVLRQKSSGTVQVIVRLTDAPLAVVVGANAKRLGPTMNLAQRQAYMATLKSKQDALMVQIRAMGGVEVGRVSKSYNGLVIAAKATVLPQIAKLPGVAALRPQIDYQISLSTTVPYIGAKALQDLGVTGAGVKIAILDTGIDYTHHNLGGSGTAADYAAASANPNVIPAGLFPTAKVIGGYDFVGEGWPNTALAPDPNPIDAGSAAGHGTHVSDIAGGASLDGTHKGVAPGAQLYAVKVCSSISTSCSDVAILQGLDWVMDPHGDLSFTDSADVVNLSLGSNYGQREDAATEAVSNVSRFGIVVAVAAGNAADRPYIVSSPSIAPEAISVAQTAVPTAVAYPLVVNAPPSIAGTYGNTATVDWAPITTGFSGIVLRAGAAGSAAALACTPATTIDFTNRVALIDRGTCSVSIKVANAAANGALGVLIANNAAGDAPSFSNGGGSGFVQTLVITQSTGNILKSVPAGTAVVTVGTGSAVGLAGSMASTSARGPGYNFSAIKPEIGAPGASVSAIYGTGNGEEAFGGTSGATPMIAGSAALLLQKFPTASPAEIKSRLMNSANNTIYTNPATQPGVLAPITRIGGGEVRVNQAAAITSGIWDAANPYSVSLAFGTVRATGMTTFSKKVAVRNYGSSTRVFAIASTFRYADDAANGAVKLVAPASISVPANGTGAFALTLTVDASKLPDWNLGAASDQGTGGLLNGVEYDGYVTVSDSQGSASVPWHILPHKAANVQVSPASVALSGSATGTLNVSNPGGATTGFSEVFALTGSSPQISTVLPPYGGGQVLIDMKAAGVRMVDVGVPAVQFAIASFGERAHPAYPAEFDVYVDSNNDGVFDYLVYNSENGGFGVSGQTLVFVQKLNPDGTANGAATAKFYVDADLNSSNMIFTVLAADIGITSPTQKFNFSIYSFDNYFTGNLTDAIVGMTHTLGTPKYSLSFDSLGTPVNGGGPLTVTKVTNGAAASPSQTGFLLMHYDAKTGRESDQVTVTP